MGWKVRPFSAHSSAMVSSPAFAAVSSFITIAEAMRPATPRCFGGAALENFGFVNDARFGKPAHMDLHG